MPAQPYIQCLVCGRLTPTDRGVCYHCHSPLPSRIILPPGTIVCPNCLKVTPIDTGYCRHCRAPLPTLYSAQQAANPQPPTNPQIGPPEHGDPHNDATSTEPASSPQTPRHTPRATGPRAECRTPQPGGHPPPRVENRQEASILMRTYHPAILSVLDASV